MTSHFAGNSGKKVTNRGSVLHDDSKNMRFLIFTSDKAKLRKEQFKSISMWKSVERKGERQLRQGTVVILNGRFRFTMQVINYIHYISMYPE